mmetsp:Transcript_106103/g.330957  ORF Transcript_106103/g.330957 Transcript_106103/m.330957 type:complete len:219 (-) Transcript_106103:63-719(-)
MFRSLPELQAVRPRRPQRRLQRPRPQRRAHLLRGHGQWRRHGGCLPRTALRSSPARSPCCWAVPGWDRQWPLAQGAASRSRGRPPTCMAALCLFCSDGQGPSPPDPHQQLGCRCFLAGRGRGQLRLCVQRPRAPGTHPRMPRTFGRLPAQLGTPTAPGTCAWPRGPGHRGCEPQRVALIHTSSQAARMRWRHMSPPLPTIAGESQARPPLSPEQSDNT